MAGGEKTVKMDTEDWKKLRSLSTETELPMKEILGRLVRDAQEGEGVASGYARLLNADRSRDTVR